MRDIGDCRLLRDESFLNSFCGCSARSKHPGTI